MTEVLPRRKGTNPEADANDSSADSRPHMNGNLRRNIGQLGYTMTVKYRLNRTDGLTDSWRLAFALAVIASIAGCLRRSSTPVVVDHYRVFSSSCDRCTPESMHASLLDAGFLDCGIAETEDDAKFVMACVLDADRKGIAFQAWFHDECRLLGQLCLDSDVGGGFVRTPEGELRQYAYDSDGSGGNRRCVSEVNWKPCIGQLVANDAGPGIDLDCATSPDAGWTNACSEQPSRIDTLGPWQSSALACETEGSSRSMFCEPGRTPRGAAIDGGFICEPARSAPQKVFCVEADEAARLFDIESSIRDGGSASYGLEK